MNYLRCMEFWILGWSSISLAFARIVNDPEQPGTTLMFLMGIPVVAMAAFQSVRMRRAHIIETPVLNLKNPFEVELKARFHMEEVITTRHVDTNWKRAYVPASVVLCVENGHTWFLMFSHAHLIQNSPLKPSCFFFCFPSSLLDCGYD